MSVGISHGRPEGIKSCSRSQTPPFSLGLLTVRGAAAVWLCMLSSVRSDPPPALPPALMYPLPARPPYSLPFSSKKPVLSLQNRNPTRVLLAVLVRTAVPSSDPCLSSKDFRILSLFLDVGTAMCPSGSGSLLRALLPGWGLSAWGIVAWGCEMVS